MLVWDWLTVLRKKMLIAREMPKNGIQMVLCFLTRKVYTIYLELLDFECTKMSRLLKIENMSKIICTSKKGNEDF